MRTLAGLSLAVATSKPGATPAKNVSLEIANHRDPRTGAPGLHVLHKGRTLMDVVDHGQCVECLRRYMFVPGWPHAARIVKDEPA